MAGYVRGASPRLRPQLLFVEILEARELLAAPDLLAPGSSMVLPAQDSLLQTRLLGRLDPTSTATDTRTGPQNPSGSTPSVLPSSSPLAADPDVDEEAEYAMIAALGLAPGDQRAAQAADTSSTGQQPAAAAGDSGLLLSSEKPVSNHNALLYNLNESTQPSPPALPNLWRVRAESSERNETGERSSAREQYLPGQQVGASVSPGYAVAAPGTDTSIPPAPVAELSGTGPALQAALSYPERLDGEREDRSTEREARPEEEAPRTALKVFASVRPDLGASRMGFAPAATESLPTTNTVAALVPSTLLGAPANEGERSAEMTSLPRDKGVAALPKHPSHSVLVVPSPSRGAPAGELPETPRQLTQALEILNLSSRAAAFLEVGLPFDLPLLKQDVDTFFARLGRLTTAPDRLTAGIGLGPWLVVLAAVAFEFGRRWEKHSCCRRLAEEDVVLGPAALLAEVDW